jgi:DNA integrity scanning protein DisA with diadenylate cyclase activity
MDFVSEILNFSIIDVLDIILVASLLYYAYKLLKGTVAINIFIGIILIYLVWRITVLLDMELLSSIIGGFMSVGIIALIVVFQPEIRKFLLMVGSTNLSKKGSFLEKIKFFKNQKLERDTTDIVSVMLACNNMSQSKTGALIVIERSNNLNFLESIFFKNSPLHDGAIIISNNFIKATRVVLPINNQSKISVKYGLRHRAAVSITEKTDAVAIVVSEENGKISYIKNGKFIEFVSVENLTKLIEKDLS